MNTSHKRTLSEDSNEESSNKNRRTDSLDSEKSFTNYVIPSMPTRKSSYDSQLSDSDVFSPSDIQMAPSGTMYSYSRSSNISNYKSDDEEDEDPLKISSFSSNSFDEKNSKLSGYSDVSMKLMKSMGYKEGRGLGASGQGRVEPIEASSQKGRRGLGHAITKMASNVCNIKYDPEKENVSVEETVEYIPSCTKPMLSADEMREWVVVGPPKNILDDEDKFCHSEILKGVLAAKDVLDSMDGRELLRARSRSNPYEALGKAFFQNRAALKMANLDAICDYMFTQPKLPVAVNGPHETSSIYNDEVLFFADVCAAPGGFAEYAIWKRRDCGPRKGFGDVHGFGFTLRSNDFKLHDFYAGPKEYFEPHYGVDGKAGDGNIFVPSNISQFCSYVKQATLERGVHFMMADGGFSVEGQENIQEILSKRLYLCQFTVALGIVREGGHFVCKLFDIFTPFSVGLIYLMYRCFREVAIHKPITSRPANSERYIICKGLHAGSAPMFKHLCDINQRMDELKPDEVMELVPHELMESDEAFMDYIAESNNSIGTQQIMALQKVHLFAEDTHKVESRQGDIRRASLAYWDIPDKTRIAPRRFQAYQRVPVLLAENKICPVKNDSKQNELKDINSLSKVISVLDYRFVFLSSPFTKKRARVFLFGLGGYNVFQSDNLVDGRWERVNHSIELPPDTLIYGEFVEEIDKLTYEPADPKSDLKNQRIVTAFHIIDGVLLNGHSIAKLHLTERNSLIRTFCISINKFCRYELVPVRCKPLLKLEESAKIFSHPHFGVRQVKRQGSARVFYCSDRKGMPHYHIPTYGMMLLRMTKDPWMMALSSRAQKKYFYNFNTKASQFDIPEESIADFEATHKTALTWHWTPGTDIVKGDAGLYDFMEEATVKDEKQLCLRHVIEKAQEDLGMKKNDS